MPHPVHKVHHDLATRFLAFIIMLAIFGHLLVSIIGHWIVAISEWSYHIVYDPLFGHGPFILVQFFLKIERIFGQYFVELFFRFLGDLFDLVGYYILITLDHFTIIMVIQFHWSLFYLLYYIVSIYYHDNIK